MFLEKFSFCYYYYKKFDEEVCCLEIKVVFVGYFNWGNVFFLSFMEVVIIFMGLLMFIFKWDREGVGFFWVIFYNIF